MRIARAVLPILATAAILVTGCGSSAKTASVNSPQTATTSSVATSSQSTSTSSSASTTSSSATSANSSVAANGGTQAESSTHTGAAPAFVQQESHEGALQSALEVLKAHGYTANETTDYHSGQTLRVLLGTRTGSADGYEQQAFFFVDGKYIGTDSSKPSAGLKVLSQGDTEVTLGYPLYKPGQPLCCGTGGEATVHFALNNGKLVPLNPIPPVESSTSPSRR